MGAKRKHKSRAIRLVGGGKVIGFVHTQAGDVPEHKPCEVVRLDDYRAKRKKWRADEGATG